MTITNKIPTDKFNNFDDLVNWLQLELNYEGYLAFFNMKSVNIIAEEFNQTTQKIYSRTPGKNNRLLFQPSGASLLIHSNQSTCIMPKGEIADAFFTRLTSGPRNEAPKGLTVKGKVELQGKDRPAVIIEEGSVIPKSSKAPKEVVKPVREPNPTFDKEFVKKIEDMVKPEEPKRLPLISEPTKDTLTTFQSEQEFQDVLKIFLAALKHQYQLIDDFRVETIATSGEEFLTGRAGKELKFDLEVTVDGNKFGIELKKDIINNEVLASKIVARDYISACERRYMHYVLLAPNVKVVPTPMLDSVFTQAAKQGVNIYILNLSDLHKHTIEYIERKLKLKFGNSPNPAQRKIKNNILSEIKTMFTVLEKIQK